MRVGDRVRSLRVSPSTPPGPLVGAETMANLADNYVEMRLNYIHVPTWSRAVERQVSTASLPDLDK